MSPKLNKFFRILGLAAVVLFVALPSFVFFGVHEVHAQPTQTTQTTQTSWMGAFAGAIAGLLSGNPTSAAIGAAVGATSGVKAGVGAAANPSSGASSGTGCGITNIGNCIGSIVALIVAIVIYIISWIAGVCIALVVFIIEIILTTTLSIVNIGIVQTGFSVVLSLANLGFVLGIIIVALATILRRETYGIKNILWKLVVMAILVNFALVIVAPLIGFSANLTNFFLQSFPGGGNGVAGVNNFASSIAHAFQPQQLVAPENQASFNSASGIAGAISNLEGGGWGQIFGGIISLLMSAIALVLIVLVLIVFAFMLLIRFAYLVFLCIIAPFAWMLWIFPKTSKYFSQWWDTFLRWTFFPPIVMFFMWLVLVVGTSTPLFGATQITSMTQISGVTSFIQNLGNQFLAPIMGTFMIDLVMIFLMMGGMYAASKMSITGASVAINAAKGVGDRVKGFAAKRGKQAATAKLRTPRNRQTFSNWQQPNQRWYKRYAGRFAEGLAVAGGEQNINKAAGEGLTSEQKVSRLATSNQMDRLGILEGMSKDELKMLSPEAKEKYFGKDTVAAFAGYGKRGSDIRKKAREESGLEKDDLTTKERELKGKYDEAVKSGAPKKEQEKLEDDRLENQKKLDDLVRKDPDDAIASFQNERQRRQALRRAEELEEKTGKPIPAFLKLDSKSAELISKQTAVVGAMVRSSPDNLNALLKALQKTNNVDEFKNFLINLQKDQPEMFKDIKQSLLSNSVLVASLVKNKNMSRALFNLDDYKEMFNLSKDDLKKYVKEEPPKSPRGKKRDGAASVPDDDGEDDEEDKEETPPPTGGATK